MSGVSLRSRPASWWNRYWFRPAPLVNLAVCRLLIVGYQLQHLHRFGILRGLHERAALPDALYDPLPVLHLLILPIDWTYRPGTAVLDSAFWLTVVSGLFGFVGLFTNWALGLFVLGNVFIQSFLYSFGDFHHGEAVVIIALGILAVSPSGSVLSLDDLRERWRENRRTRGFAFRDVLGAESRFARWGPKLVQWCFALIYLSAAYFKLHGKGLSWLNGYTLRYGMTRDGYRWGLDVAIWLGQQHELAVVMSWATVLFEATFFTVLLFPVLAWVYVPAGAALHLGIFATMRATFLGYLPTYSVFVSWNEALKRLREWWLNRTGGSRRVFYDSDCRLCTRTMTVIGWLDWLASLDYRGIEEAARSEELPEGVSPDELRREMHVSLPDGRCRTGFFAYRAMLPHLPLLWPFLPLAYLPGASRVGRRVYEAISRRRRRGCESGRCRYPVDETRDGSSRVSG